MRMRGKRKNCMQIMLDIVSAYFLACEPRQKLTFSPRRNTGSRQSRQQRDSPARQPLHRDPLPLILSLCVCVCLCVQPVANFVTFFGAHSGNVQNWQIYNEPRVQCRVALPTAFSLGPLSALSAFVVGCGFKRFSQGVKMCLVVVVVVAAVATACG